MPMTSKLSKYLKADMVHDGDVITFIDAGVILDKEFKNEGETQIKPILEITVEIKGEHKTYSPNGTTVKILSEAWGQATEEWVNKQARITVVPASNGKDMIIAKPLND